MSMAGALALEPKLLLRPSEASRTCTWNPEMNCVKGHSSFDIFALLDFAAYVLQVRSNYRRNAALAPSTSSLLTGSRLSEGSHA